MEAELWTHFTHSSGAFFADFERVYVVWPAIELKHKQHIIISVRFLITSHSKGFAKIM